MVLIPVCTRSSVRFLLPSDFATPLKSIDYGERGGRFLVAPRIGIAYLEGPTQDAFPL